ncbi:GTPase-activating protein BEM3-like [Teratosphaeria destructans]|uniref:GTPase-activating protein BEM3-like n=1 Tax=Teratosphaeria destructans TaxID=418781 RepID=A0A9W7SZF1_9PEZI|nr:GTPase-activating protein BEM3-like [Teratosphaeria destructans]
MSTLADAVDQQQSSDATHLIGSQNLHTPHPTTNNTTARYRPVPSPLQESTSARSASGDRLHSQGVPRPSLRGAPSQEHAPATTNPPQILSGDRVRAPNPGKKAARDPELDQLRSAVTRDALREQAKEQAAASHSNNKPQAGAGNVLSAAHQQSSPPASPTTMLHSKTPSRADHAPGDERPIMTMRNASIDSTVSSLSSASQRPIGTSAYRAASESAGPQDVASCITAAGSPAAAVEKLLNEKNQAASHNAQLWRLVEKQRAMILGLNKDLEKALKEKERYRKKLKDQLFQSQSAPNMPFDRAGDDFEVREPSESPAISGERKGVAVAHGTREFSLDSRKVSDVSDAPSFQPGRSDTPQDATKEASSSGLPATPQSAGSMNTAQEPESAGHVHGQVHLERQVLAPIDVYSVSTGTPPMSPKAVSSPASAGMLNRSKASIPQPGQGMSSPKSATTRKAPPAPLQLSAKPVEIIMDNVVDPSDSEYEDDPESARAEQMMRGRRKTREEDDRQREAHQQEIEERSRSNKKSKSKSKPPTDRPEGSTNAKGIAGSRPSAVEQAAEPRARVPIYQANADPAALIRQRAVSDAAGMLQKSNTAPTLLSPGLPMSPRPSDKPLNSPMPRVANKMLNSLPMSPKGMAGLPLSPRAPRQPLPMPPQTPLTFASPHLVRAEAYNQQAEAQQPSVGDAPKPSPEASSEHETRLSISSDPNAKSPGEVYRGLVTEQYPDLLLPPNALPSIYIKTSSSRMKPSRQSIIMPKQFDESPVLTLAVHERSDNKQLWRIEKTVAALILLDSQVKSVSAFRDRLPEKAVFTGHAPAKIDSRRVAVDRYLDRMLDAIQSDTAAKVICKFLSSDAIGAEAGDYFGPNGEVRPDTPVSKHRPQRAGFLTKRGKNFGGWKARYFVLNGPVFKYFEAPGGAQLGSIKLFNAQIGRQSAQSQAAQEDEDNQFRHAFLILEPKKKDSSSLVRHVLCAESDEERDAWVEALLQYVDAPEDDEQVSKGVQYVTPGPDIGGARSPRLQKSMNDLRPDARSRETDSLRGMRYNETVAGEAPMMGALVGSMTNTSSPSHDAASFSGQSEHSSSSSHPTISGPTNLQVISNTEDWGMKPPPTPQSLAKDKKRSMFAAFRGRSSSDLAPGTASAQVSTQDQKGYNGIRAVFGVPLAEAVQFAHPSDATTDLPAVVYRCIEYLIMKNAVSEEGIFRLSGSNTVIKALKDRFNVEGDVNLASDDHHYDIHAVASLLKLYLRELPSSILTRDLHLEFLHCLEMHGVDKVTALNVLVNRLPTPNRALLHALSEFLLSIVNNADINKMNVRNVGIVFAPTLNVPAPLISSFVEDQATIFGPPIDEAESPISATEITAPGPNDLRSPRKQMFSDLPTPAYNQTSFQFFSGSHGSDTGMIPMQPSYASYQMAPQGDGAFGSLNDALRSPTIYNAAASAMSSVRDVKSRRRESAMMMLHPNKQPQHKTSMSKLREEGASL